VTNAKAVMVQKRKKPINVVLSQFRRQNAPAGGGNQSRNHEGAELERQERKWSVASSERQSRERQEAEIQIACRVGRGLFPRTGTSRPDSGTRQFLIF